MFDVRATGWPAAQFEANPVTGLAQGVPSWVMKLQVLGMSEPIALGPQEEGWPGSVSPLLLRWPDPVAQLAATFALMGA